MSILKIKIQNNPDYCLTLQEIRFTLRTLLVIAGFPHQFMRDDASEPPDLFFGTHPHSKAAASILMATVSRDTIETPKSIHQKNNIIYLNFSSDLQAADETVDKTRIFTYDILLTSFYLLTGMQEKFIRLDKNNIHHIQDSWLYQHNLLHTPIINQYALCLREIFKSTHSFIPSWPENKQYALVLSHDCDYPEIIRSIETLRYLLKNRSKSKISTISNIVTGKETFWKFDEWIDLESRFKTKSAFYFCGLNGNLIRYITKAPDPFYDVSSSKFTNLIQSLESKGFEVGMHASYFAHQSIDQFRKEKNIIEQSTKSLIVGNRHHYWHMNPHRPYETAQQHHEIGLLYDSSISFERHSGFRYSICSPFHLYHPELKKLVPTLQLPPSLMDDHLFGHAKFSRFNNFKDHIDSILRAVKSNEGVFVADYHVRVLNETFYPQWGDSYRYLLKKVSECQDFYCATPKVIAKFWLDREQKILEASPHENCCINK